MLRHVYIVIERYDCDEGTNEEFLAAFSNPVNANQYAKTKYDVKGTKHISNCAIHTVDENISVEVRLIALDRDIRNS